MGKLEKYINKIVENGKSEDMECLSNMLSEIIYMMKEPHKDLYNKYKNKLVGMAYDYKFDEDYADEIVENMTPYGEYWSIDTIRNVIGNVPDLVDYYIVMNSLVNDYNEAISPENTDTYVKMAKAFINDDDASENKVWKYFTTIPKK